MGSHTNDKIPQTISSKHLRIGKSQNQGFEEHNLEFEI